MGKYLKRFNYLHQSNKRAKQVLFRKMVASGVLTALFVGIVSPFAVTVKAAENGSTQTQEVIVVYNNEDGKDAVLAESTVEGHEFDSIPAVSATLTNADIAKLESNPDVAFIEPNITFTLSGEVTTQGVMQPEGGEWGINAVNPNGQSLIDDNLGSGIKVAVIDSGVSSHSDLNVLSGVSTVDALTGLEPESLLPSAYDDENGHGTHVAGIIGAENNGTGVVGVAPSADILAVKAIGATGEGNLQDLLEGIDWSINEGADVINLSLGSATGSPSLEVALNEATDQGIVVVAASGNDDGAPVGYPAAYENVIAVSAIDETLNLASFSNFGPEIDFTAPGDMIASTYLEGGYAFMSGTSQATPHVAGLVAVVKEQLIEEGNLSPTVAEIRAELKSRVTDLGDTGFDDKYGHGLVTYTAQEVDTLAPAEVIGLTASDVTDTSAKISFTEPLDEDYAKSNVYENGNLVLEFVKGELTEFDITELDPETQYTFTVKTEDETGNESTGVEVVFTTEATVVVPPVDTTAPAEVTDLAVSDVTDTTATISFTQPVDVDFFTTNIYDNEGLIAQILNGEETLLELTGLTPNTEYTYTFKTEDVTGNESTGEQVTFTTEETVAEEPPVEEPPVEEPPAELPVINEMITVGPSGVSVLGLKAGYEMDGYTNIVVKDTEDNILPDNHIIQGNVEYKIITDQAKINLTVNLRVMTINANQTVEDYVSSLDLAEGTFVEIKDTEGNIVTGTTIILDGFSINIDYFDYLVETEEVAEEPPVEEPPVEEPPVEEPPVEEPVAPEVKVIELPVGSTITVAEYKALLLAEIGVTTVVIKDLNDVEVVDAETILADGFKIFVNGVEFTADVQFRPLTQEEQEELDRLEAERLEAERLEAERLARLEAERLEAERLARLEAERLEAERLARLEAERLEAERIARENAARLEAERIARENAARLEAERIARENAEKARLEREAKAKAEKEAKEKAEREAKAKAEKEAKEKAAREAKEKADAKAKAEREAKAKAEKEAKANADAIKKSTEASKKAFDKKINNVTQAKKEIGNVNKTASAIKVVNGKPDAQQVGTVVGQYQVIASELAKAKQFTNVVAIISDATEALTKKKVDKKVVMELVRKNITTSRSVQVIINDLKKQKLDVTELVKYQKELQAKEAKAKKK